MAGGLVASAAMAALAACRGLGGRTSPGGPGPVPVPGGYIGRFKIQRAEAGGVPAFVEADWRLVIDGLVAEPLALTWKQVLALPQSTMTNTFECVEGWTVPNVHWQGIRLADLMQRVRPRPQARFVVFTAEGGSYTDNLSLAQASDPRAMLAVRMDGKPLDPRLGAPLRLVVPWMYGYKSVKWLRHIEFVARAAPGYWEERGYPTDAELPG